MKKGDGSQVKESTDSSTTLEDDDIKGKREQCAACFLLSAKHENFLHQMFFVVNPMYIAIIHLHIPLVYLIIEAMRSPG